MRSITVKFGVLLAILTMALPLLAGCGSKSEEKDSGGYYTGPMQGKGTAGQGAGAKKQD